MSLPFSPGPLEHIVEGYIKHGDNIPPQEKLEEYDELLSTGDRPYYWLVAADVEIDLATLNPQNASTYFNHAEENLEAVIESTQQLEELGYFNQSFHATSAALRLTELPYWAQAAEGNFVEFDYEQILAGAMRVIPYAKQGSLSISTLAEFMPILLISRMQHDVSNELISRMSLEREDKGLVVAGEPNPNWDVGISAEENYINPDVKVQVKSRTSANTKPYKKAGLAVLTASKVGINSPIQVARSCMREHDTSSFPTREGIKKRFLSTGELDEITEKMMKAIGLGSSQALVSGGRRET